MHVDALTPHTWLWHWQSDIAMAARHVAPQQDKHQDEQLFLFFVQTSHAAIRMSDTDIANTVLSSQDV